MRSLLIALAVVSMVGTSAAAAEGARPDVLLITIDTLRADNLGTYGFPQPVSPEIDAIASQGVVFERAIAASSATAPSHASIFTSLYPRQHSVGPANGPTRLVDATTLAEVFSRNGYRTAAVVGNMMLHHSVGLHRGFGRYDDRLHDAEQNRPGIFERVAVESADRALAWLAEAGDGPVFLWLHLQDPHGPYTPPPGFESRITLPPQPGEKPLPVLSGNNGWGGIPAYQVLPGLFLPSQYRARYSGEILYADEQLGRVAAAFAARRPDVPAITLITADHGESFGEEDRWFVHYYTTTPANAHVPLIVRAPGIPPGRRSELVSHVDIAPTLLDLAGLKAPPEMAGVSLVPLLRGEADALPQRFVYCDIGHELSAYRGEGFVRVRGAMDLWKDPPKDPDSYPTPLWVAESWDGGPRWKRLPSEGPLDPSIRAYVFDTVPWVNNDGPITKDEELLRALGYVD